MRPSIVPLSHLEGNTYWREWERNKFLKRRYNGGGRVSSTNVEVDFSKFTPDKYLLSWATIVSGVEPEHSDGHTIVTPHNKWINDNGGAWLNQVLLENYHTFILAENYLEHLQVPDFSKGKVLDAVAWVVEQQITGYPEPIPTVFVDILVATNKIKHPKLVQSIKTGLINALSMGCDVSHTQCSRCGNITEEQKDPFCKHIAEQLGRYYTDLQGNRRRVAELYGVPGRKGSCTFEEASWVQKPAFMWAKLHAFVDYGKKSTGRVLKAFVPHQRLREAARE